MRNKVLSIIFTCAIIVLACNTAFAVGVGLYFHSEGNKTWETGRMWDYGYGLGGGFVLDTSVARNNVFNYRLNIDISYFGIMNRGTGIRVTGTHTFGFGFIRTETIRVWMGPQILVGYNDVSYGMDVGLGLALGMNIHLSSVVSLALDLGVRGGGTLYYSHFYESMSGDYYRAGYRLNAKDGVIGIFCNVGLLFRVSDRYRKEDGGEFAAQRQKQIEEFILTNASVMTEKQAYRITDPVIVVYKNLPDSKYCWIAISKAGDPDGSYESYNWTYASTEGKMNFGMLYLQPGSYEIRLHLSRGNTVSKRYAFKVE